MSEYTPPYHLTDKMLTLVVNISEKIGQIKVYQNLDSKPHLRRNNKIRSIYSSLRIEANSLSLGEVKDIINGKTVVGKAKEIQEVKNAYKAYDMIPKMNPYSIQDLKRIHGILTDFIQEDAGNFRTGNEGVFSGDTCIFMAPPPNIVNELMNHLFQWMGKKQSAIHPLILSAIFHYEFVLIHPFSDGNGRTARLWHTLILRQWNPLFEYVPLESQIERFQDGYYEAIASCHKDGESTLFIEFMLEQIDAIMGQVMQQVSAYDDESSEYIKHLLDVMDFNVPYAAKVLMERLGLKSRESFRQNYLKPALDKGLVVRTVPEKPNSRNQKYIKK